MKSKQLLEWYKYIDSKKLDTDQAMILVHIFMGFEESKILKYDGCLIHLKKNGYLTDDNRLTDKALDLSFISGKRTSPETELLAKKIRDIFPIKIIRTSKKPARASISEMATKLEWFKLEYPYYSDEVILQATRDHIDHFDKQNYDYMQTSSYFISKEDNGAKYSSLAAWCQKIIDEEKESSNQKSFEINV